MKLIEEVPAQTVWNDWMLGENISNPDFRSDIRKPLPTDTRWHAAFLGEHDVERLFIISSSDWTEISERTFLAKRVADVVNDPLKIQNLRDKDSARILAKINSKVEYFRAGNTSQSHLILVSNDLLGPFTLIEGNHRAVAYLELKALVGSKIYLGLSRQMRNYCWAKKSFNSSAH